MAVRRAADGQEWPYFLRVAWTTFERDQFLFREVWQDLSSRVENLLRSAGVGSELYSLHWSDDDRRSVAVPWSERRHDRLVSRFDKVRMHSVGTTWMFPNRHVGLVPTDVSLNVSLDLPPDLRRPDYAAQVLLSVRTTFLEQSEEDAIADGLLSWLGPVGARLTATYGYATRDPNHDHRLTPYEYAYRVGPQGKDRSEEFARGYFWANLLNPRHIERLGGLRDVTRRCETSGLVVEPVERDGELQHLIVRIPSPITSYTDDQLCSVKNLVEPILIKSERWTAKNQVPVRVLDD